ncbi:hypothetical protein [Prochlorococcus sp. MIT 1307]|uniref:hypothetical protein n=1 Tax=Prochlorococcus sp. MIT 1307 TaxID=3096219 RepID=UPI002A74E6BE|nr:hypothetical protein [Prochlorococcus sp. MIT 1307]
MDNLNLDQVKQEIKVYLFVVIPLAIVMIQTLLGLLRQLINKQVDKQFDKFASEARIPKFLRSRIGIKFKWK